MRKRISKSILSVLLSVAMVVPTMAAEGPAVEEVVMLEEEIDSEDAYEIDEVEEVSDADDFDLAIEEESDSSMEESEIIDSSEITALEETSENITEEDILVESELIDETKLSGDEVPSTKEAVEETVDEEEVVLVDAVTYEETVSDQLSDALVNGEEEITCDSVEIIGETITSDNILKISNDDLFEGYVKKVFGIEDEASEDGGDYHGSKLTGLEKEVYDALREAIFEIAAGERESTKILIPVDLSETKCTWTLDELEYEGKPSVLETKEQMQKAAEAAFAKMKENINFNQVHLALLYDLPYELYWYSKIDGMGNATSYASTCTSMSVTISSYNTVVVFYVDPFYSKTHTKKTYEVDTALLASTKTAATNARKVVTQNAGLDDYHKMEAYKDYICSVVKYNYDAVDKKAEWEATNLNPWQLIYVFDENPKTNVVCEGYSKAFQYLCDMSTFEDEGTRSFIVSGFLADTVKDLGGHMWNIVNYKGGNYLVDVTNHDSGHNLFMVGTDEVKSENGVKRYYFSNNNLNYYYRDDMKKLYTDAELEYSKTDAPIPTGKILPTVSDFDYSNTSVAFDGSAKSALVNVKSSVSGMGSYTVKYVTKGGSKDSLSASAPVNVGEYDVYVDIEEGTSYKTTILKLGTLTITKGIPTYTAPEDINVDCNVKTCGQVDLSEYPGFSFMNENATLSVGANTVYLRYDDDDANYDIVENIEITIIKGNHSYALKQKKSVADRTIPPTCSEPGKLVYKYLCDNGCGTESSEEEEVIDESKPATGEHDITTGTWNKLTHTIPCATCGQEVTDDGNPSLTAEVIDGDIADVTAKISVTANDNAGSYKSGIDKYYLVCRESSVDSLSSADVAKAENEKTVNSGKIALSGLKANTKYYCAIVVSDKAGNLSDVKKVIFDTQIIVPKADVNNLPKLTGTYGQKVSELILTEGKVLDPYTNDEIAGTWTRTTEVSVLNKILHVNSTDEIDLIFAPDSSEYSEITTSIRPVINKKDVTVTIDNAERYYNESNPTFAIKEVEGLILGDTESSLGVTLNTAATVTTNVGDYDITGSANNTDYNVIFNNGTLKIKKTEYKGSKASSLSLAKAEGKTSSINLPILPVGASYETIDYLGNEGLVSAAISGNKLTVTSKGITSDDVITISVNVVNATNYEDYVVSIDITPCYTYIISFDAAGGNCSVESIETGTNCKLPTIPSATKTGYDFDGWYVNGSKISSSTVFDSDVTAVAKWNLAHLAKSEYASDSSYHWNSCVVGGCTEIYHKAAHSWDGGKVTKAATVSTTGAKEYKCTVCGYTKSETIAKIVYTITFDAAGGNCATRTANTTDGKLSSVPMATRNGYEFVGWYYNGAKITSSTVFSSNATVVAKWNMLHASQSIWESDDDNHWHTCVVSGCTEIYNKAAHTWDGGVVTKEATESVTGVKTYTCSVCGYKKNETIPTIEKKTGKWVKVNGKYKWKYANGKYAVSKWETIGGKYYHFNSKGYRQTGWIKVKNKWYYLNSKGVMLTGWQKISKKWYYLNSSGVMTTGWKKISGKKYYFKSSGEMATGWVKVSGKYYYLYKDGHMATNKWIGKYHVNGKGVRDKKR